MNDDDGRDPGWPGVLNIILAAIIAYAAAAAVIWAVWFR